MKNDLLTKSLLLVIAIALSAIAIRPDIHPILREQTHPHIRFISNLEFACCELRMAASRLWDW